MDFSNEPENVIYLAGGCFWGMEKLMQSIPGVIDVKSGYANGTCEADANYRAVCAGNTGFRETVRVECTFPDDYANDPHLAGKTVQLDCEILFISETLPELTDEWVRNNRGCETVKEYEEKIRTKALMEKLERNWAGEKLLEGEK